MTNEDIQAWNAAIGRGARPLRKRDWVCCCGKELDGSHDHNSCGPPEPRTGGEVVTSEEIQADAEAQVVPREIADRLAGALQMCDRLGSRGTTDDGYSVSWYIHAALDEYRKAVSP